jgi:predicted transcriptional regulator YdeE
VLWWCHLYAEYRDIVECDQPYKAGVLPAHTYLRVIHRGTARALSFTLDYTYHTWLPQSDYYAALPWYVEHYSTTPGRSGDGVWDVYLPVDRIEQGAPTTLSATAL